MATEGLADLERRGLDYLRAGYPLHLRGPAGSGKTTLALRLADQLKRPIVLLVGDASFDTSRLVGGEEVTRTKRVVDRYISSVMKVENQTNAVWLDRALTVACTEGGTLVYDEFNRAPASANNVLLTVLEERVLVLPKTGRGESYVPVHPRIPSDVHLQPGRPCRHQSGAGRADRPDDHARPRRLRARHGSRPSSSRAPAWNRPRPLVSSISCAISGCRANMRSGPLCGPRIMIARIAAAQQMRVSATIRDLSRSASMCWPAS